MMNYTGQCSCQLISFNTIGNPLFTQYCHCEKCREIAALSQNPTDKIGYSFTAAYLTERFTITKGQGELEKIIRNNSNLLLCKHCKNLLYGISQDPNKQAGIGINVNNFIFESGLPAAFNPDKHIWYENRIIDIDDTLPKYKDAPKEQFGSGILINNK